MDGYAGDGNENKGRGGAGESGKGIEGWLSGCFAFLARAPNI